MFVLADVALLATGVVILPISAAPKLPTRLKQPCQVTFFAGQVER